MRQCQSLRRHASAAAISALACFIAAPALAQGVVVETTSTAHVAGTIITPGDAIVLAAGEHVIVLDRSGETARFDESSVYRADESAGVGSANEMASPLRAAVWTARRADIGGTRTTTYEDCLAAAEIEADLTPQDCEVWRRPAPEPPRLSVAFMGDRTDWSPGETLRLQLRSNYDADVSCLIGSVGSDAGLWRLAIGHGGPDSLRVMKNRRAYAPSRGATHMRAPEKSGDYRLICVAIEPATGHLFRPAEAHIETAEARDSRLLQFAMLRGDPASITELPFTVIAD